MNRRGFFGTLAAALVASRITPPMAPLAFHADSFSMVSQGWDSGLLLQKGDIFTISGTFSVNPETYTVTDVYTSADADVD